MMISCNVFLHFVELFVEDRHFEEVVHFFHQSDDFFQLPEQLCIGRGTTVLALEMRMWVAIYSFLFSRF
jgi:hypothetical protein